MKHRTLRRLSLGVSLTFLTFASTTVQSFAEPVAPPAETIFPNPVGNAEAESKGTAEELAPPADSDAPVTFVSAEKALPSSIRPSSPVNEVVKLANSGVSESVMLAYVTNSVHTFNLGAEEIIYLNDIGVPGAVVTAMIQRDQELKSAFAAAANPPPPPEQPVPEQLPPPDTASVEAPLTPPDDGSGDMFYDSLAPYGNWVDVEGYGRCWQPTVVVVNPGWQPYFDCGHWIYSDCGWYWSSSYSWGWAPFHYGSWFRHSHLGWCWVPGHTWGPSWVSWRYNDHYCGWAPLPPSAHFVAGVGLTFHGHGIWDRDDFGLRPSHYRFVAWNNFHDRQLSPAGLRSNDLQRVYDQSTVATRINGDGHNVINNGLPVSRVAAATHRPIHTVMLRDSTEPVRVGNRTETVAGGGGQTLAVYRPRAESVMRTWPGQRGTGIRGGSTMSAVPSATAPWGRSSTISRSTTVSGPDRTTTTRQQTSPLILRGAQTSALNETVPPSSLVIIGRSGSQPSAPSSASARSAPSAPAWARSTSAAPAQSDNLVPQRRPAGDLYLNQQGDWRGTVSSSPTPSWFNSTTRPEASSPGTANAGPRPDVRTYQPAQRVPAAEIPRYAPAAGYTPRSYSAPSWSAPARSQSYSQPAPQPSMGARPAAPAPSAPAAAAASSGSRSSSSSSNNRGGR